MNIKCELCLQLTESMQWNNNIFAYKMKCNQDRTPQDFVHSLSNKTNIAKETETMF